MFLLFRTLTFFHHILWQHSSWHESERASKLHTLLSKSAKLAKRLTLLPNPVDCFAIVGPLQYLRIGVLRGRTAGDGDAGARAEAYAQIQNSNTKIHLDTDFEQLLPGLMTITPKSSLFACLIIFFGQIHWKFSILTSTMLISNKQNKQQEIELSLL